ncbi:MAG: DUF805 domain-containing protein [Proteobacteria bacterium]|nr:DUF805 domain-containing protein [Pseudomonadota bacterium]
MEWMLMPFRRYADFSGRSRRMEYWMFRLFEFGVFFAGLIVLGLFSGAAGAAGGDTASGLVGGLGALALVGFFLFSFIPGLAVTVRRLHDTGKSGWMVLISLVPLVGGIVLLVFLCSDGTRGANQYGEDPKAHTDHAGDVFA